jgi:hypothetical protein
MKRFTDRRRIMQNRIFGKRPDNDPSALDRPLKGAMIIATWGCAIGALFLVRHLGAHSLLGQSGRMLLALYLGLMAAGLRSGWKLAMQREEQADAEKADPMTHAQLPHYPPRQLPPRIDPWLWMMEIRREFKDGEQVLVAWPQFLIIGPEPGRLNKRYEEELVRLYRQTPRS